MKRNQPYTCTVTVLLLFCSLIALPPAYPQADRGVALLNSYEFVKAEAMLREALKSNPESLSTQYYLGIALLQQKKYSEALKELKSVENKQNKTSLGSHSSVPSAFQTDLALAQAYIGLNRFTEAWPKLESARLAQPESSDVYLQQGVYYYKQKNYEKSIKDLEQAIHLDADNAYAYYYLGMAYSKTESIDLMLEVFKKFLELAPDAPEAPAIKKKVDEMC